MLEIIWFSLWGLLWAIYFMLDGFDLGIGAMIPFLGKTDSDRRKMMNAMGPFWDGNEVWLITAGGVTFAAFPGTYAVMFSSMYSALLIVLFGLIFRGAAMELRNRMPGASWRKTWDACLFLGSITPALLFGVAFANIFQGMPIDAEGTYHGTLFTLLNPYGLLGGVTFLLLFLEHGALWLAYKTDGDLHDRAAKTAAAIWPILLLVAAGFLAASYFKTTLYANCFTHPVMFIFPTLAVAGLVITRIQIASKNWLGAWFSSCATIAGATLFGVAGLYPSLFPSSIDKAFSMTIANSASSPLTLKIMLCVTLFFIPIVIGYQGWVYFLFKGKVSDEEYHEG